MGEFWWQRLEGRHDPSDDEFAEFTIRERARRARLIAREMVMGQDSKVKKAVRSFTLPQSVLKDLTFVAKSLGVSQSALLGEVLGPPISDLRRIIEESGSSADGSHIMRMRGASARIIAERVREALAQIQGAV